MTTDELTTLADRLEAYNRWRRDGYDTSKMKYDPEPFRIGLDIDEAVKVIRLAAAPDDHLYEGDCPDPLQPDARDPECPACQRMGPAA
jgi:hypothetical protein